MWMLVLTIGVQAPSKPVDEATLRRWLRTDEPFRIVKALEITLIGGERAYLVETFFEERTRNFWNVTVLARPKLRRAREVDVIGENARTLQALPEFRSVPGRLPFLSILFNNFPVGIIHFAGHGAVKPNPQGILEYFILLEDTDLDLLTFRGLTSKTTRSHPFIFFNACHIGQCQRVANFVNGWAPAVLEAGASGYVGGLWPLGDRGAAEFAVHFYKAFEQDLKRGPVNVSDILRSTRRLFYDQGDPTFLAYVYYGDPHFRFVPGRLRVAR